MSHPKLFFQKDKSFMSHPKLFATFKNSFLHVLSEVKAKKYPIFLLSLHSKHVKKNFS
jgi:hypothetical protein